jgi:mannose-6-phosphate isomerase-like protein (cupin superfamily)
MSKRVGAAILLLAFTAVAAADEEWLHLGEPLTAADTTPIEEIANDPEAFHDRMVRIEGRIASVCTQEGCFIEVVPVGGGEGIVVNFPGLAHTFPTDCAGLEAVVEGRFYRKIYPRARVSHWQQHSFRPGQVVPEYSLALRMDARGAEVGGARAPIPPPAPVPPADPARLDLMQLDFEAEGFGIGRQVVPPGGVVLRPSTGGNRWLVVCRDGTLSVHREDRDPPVVLAAGEVSFLPAGVMFEVRNESGRDASLDLIYSRRIEPPPPAPHRH